MALNYQCCGRVPRNCMGLRTSACALCSKTSPYLLRCSQPEMSGIVCHCLRARLIIQSAVGGKDLCSLLLSPLIYIVVSHSSLISGLFVSLTEFFGSRVEADCKITVRFSSLSSPLSSISAFRLLTVYYNTCSKWYCNSRLCYCMSSIPPNKTCVCNTFSKKYLILGKKDN